MRRRLRVIAEDLAYALHQDCWRELFVESRPVLQPNWHIPDRTGVPVVDGFSAPETDSAPKSKSQSAGRRAAPQPDSKNRTVREHRPHCTECGEIALHQTRTHSDHAKMWPLQRGRYSP